MLLSAQTLYAAGLSNLAALELIPLWQDQSAQVFDPPCRAAGTFLNLAQRFQPSIALGHARALTHWGRVRWLEGHCTEAIEAWEQAWTRAGDQAAAFELVRVGEYAVLPLEMRQIIAEGFYQSGRNIAKAQGDQSALGWLRRSFDLMPQHINAGALVEQYRKSEDTAAIYEVWHKMAATLPSTNAEHWWAVAELRNLENQWEAAAQSYERGAELAGEPYEFWMGAGRAWLQARQWGAAVAAYERAYEVNPAAWTCVSLGRVYYARGDYASALQWYLEAKAKSPKEPEPYYRLGETYYTMGDYGQAQQYFSEALGIDPDHFLSMYYVAQIFYKEGDFGQAEKWILEALSRIPWRGSRTAWWLELGDWRLGWRDCVGARDAYTSAREAGASEQILQQKLIGFEKICTP